MKPRHIGTGTLILGQVQFGIEVWVGHYCLLDGMAAPITIGDYSVIASFVRIYTHDTSHRTAYGQVKEIAPVIIGAFTQIGDGAVVLPGVRIGDHVIVGANTVVNKNLPDYSLAVGNPVVIKEVKSSGGEMK